MITTEHGDTSIGDPMAATPITVAMGYGMTCIITHREFLARRLAYERLLRAGNRANACGAARIAAKLFRNGASVDAAARRAAQQIGGAGTHHPHGDSA